MTIGPGVHSGSPERVWQCANTELCAAYFRPQSVLEVGNPVHPKLLGLWGDDCLVETVDPKIEESTYVQKFEDFRPARRYDVINMTSVLDVFNDPVLVLKLASKCADAMLLQGKLNTYLSDKWPVRAWAPSRIWVEKRLQIVAGLEYEPIDFFGDQMFCVMGKFKPEVSRYVGYGL